jgi:hypothetical protein
MPYKYNPFTGTFDDTSPGTLAAAASGTAAAPGIYFSADINTGIYNPSADALGFATNGIERARLDSSGRLLVGLSTSVGGGAAIQSVSSVAQVFEGIANRNDIYGSFLYLTKSRGTISSPTIVSNNDIVGAITFKAYSGTNYFEVASIEADIDGTPGASDMPSRLMFFTTADGASNYTERMRIDNAGRVLVGLTSANTSGAKLQTSDGLTFPATQVASADPNTLDDYEEGTFTPTVIGLTTAGTATYAVQSGIYTKIGRAVTYTIYVNYSAGTGTGSFAIAGLPFTANSYFSAAFSLVDNITLPALSVIGGYTDSGFSRIIIVAQPVGGGTYSTVSYDAAGGIILTGTYFTT